ncbi:MAG: EAL domain-containing protein [Pseudomonadota bacterium]
MTLGIVHDFFLGKQSILNRQQHLAGFKLLFRSGQGNAARFSNHIAATSSVIAIAYNELGFNTVLGKFKGYINVNETLLMDGILEMLPPDKVVLEILETVQPSTAVIERCRQLKQRGFALALDDYFAYSDKSRPLLDIVDIVKVDIKQIDSGGLRNVVATLKQWPLQLLAEKVDNRDAAKLCEELGFDLFQGHYYAKPIIITGKRLSHSELELMRLLGMVMADADTAEIEQVIKRNPDLGLSLLRLTNSVATGTRQKVTSLNRAITVLGRRELQRWVQLLLFTNQNPEADFPNPLLQLAAMRGKFMELLAGEMSGHNRDDEDHAFMTGIMSLMDTLLSMPLAEIIATIDLAPEVRAALLERSGILGNLLKLTEKLEENDMAGMSEILEQLSRHSPLTLHQVNTAQMEALRWANSIGDEIQQ